jgi:hypothetical protein
MIRRIDYPDRNMGNYDDGIEIKIDKQKRQEESDESDNNMYILKLGRKDE